MFIVVYCCVFNVVLCVACFCFFGCYRNSWKRHKKIIIVICNG